MSLASAVSLEGLVSSFATLVVIGNLMPLLPVIADYTSELERGAARKLQLTALAGAYAVAGGFVLLGPALLGLVQITENDLRIAGGTILLVYATHDLLFSRAQRNRPPIESELHALAPLGIPIMVGPATLSTALVLAGAYGVLTALVALLLAGLLNVGVLLVGERLIDRLGVGISRAVGKVMSLFLAALGVAMLRLGIAAALS